MLKGRLDHENQYPWQSINYCESHDDYAFIDRICLENDEGGMNPDKVAVEKAKLALVILLLSPGVPMISAGQDFLRSKRGIRNTYKHGEVNALDYERLNTFKDFSLEIREIINFRLSERGELEISDLNNIYMNQKKLNVEILGRGIAWLDTGTFESLQDASFFIKTLEMR